MARSDDSWVGWLIGDIHSFTMLCMIVGALCAAAKGLFCLIGWH